VRQALALLGSASQGFETSSLQELVGPLARTAAVLRLARPIMVPIGYWADRFDGLLAETRDLTMPEMRSVMASAARSLVDEAERMSHRVAENVAGFLTNDDTVVTASYSSSVASGLRRATGADKRIRVLPLASGGDRPSFGGRVADAARSAGLEALVIPDTDLMSAVQQADLALIGADSVMPDGAVVNGAPSGLLAEAAHGAGRPVIVAAGPAKRVKEDSPALAWLRRGRL